MELMESTHVACASSQQYVRRIMHAVFLIVQIHCGQRLSPMAPSVYFNSSSAFAFVIAPIRCVGARHPVTSQVMHYRYFASEAS